MNSNYVNKRTRDMRLLSKMLAVFAIMIVCVSSFAQTKGYEKSIELNGGIPIDNQSKFAIGITMMNGYRFNDCFYLGAGAGYEYFDALYSSSHEYISKGDSKNTKSYYGKSIIRLFGRIKANLTKTKISPYFAGDIGYGIDLNANEWGSTSGLMFESQFGLDFKLQENIGMYFAVGFRGQQNSYTAFNLTLGESGHEKRSYLAEQIGLKFGIVF